MISVEFPSLYDSLLRQQDVISSNLTVIVSHLLVAGTRQFDLGVFVFHLFVADKQ